MADFIISGNDFSWTLDFAGSGGGDVDFSKTQVRAMRIEETMFEPFYRGSITFLDPANIIESRVMARGDGSEKVTIDFKPSESSPGEGSVKFEFVLNGEANAPALNSRLNAFKTYDLLDANYFKLNQPIPYGERFRGKVGDILKKIFEDKELPIGEWASGDHEVDIFPEHILPPTSYRYSDLVKYLMRINYNTGGGGYAGEGTAVRSLLYWDRSEGNYVFKPLDKIFSSPTSIETFVCGEFASGESNANNPGGGGPTYVSSMLKASDLTTPMLTYSNEYFMNFLVTGYDPQLGEHGIREIRIEDVKKKWDEELSLPSLGGGSKAFMPLNKAKKHELFRTFSLPFSLDKSAKLAEAEMIGNMTFYNMELCVRQDGHPARTAGAFVDVKNSAKAMDGDAKLCGTWLITKCTHEFIQDSYYNTVNCIKPVLGQGSDSGGAVDSLTKDN